MTVKRNTSARLTVLILIALGVSVSPPRIPTSTAEIDRALDGQLWLTGDAFTLADITWIPLHVSLDNAGFPFHRYANVARWMGAVRARPSFERAVRNWTGVT